MAAGSNSRVSRSLSMDAVSPSLIWKPVMVFYHPSMKRLAEGIVEIGSMKTDLVC